jgi:ribosomal-protein-alanine N-acetyltransferase
LRDEICSGPFGKIAGMGYFIKEKYWGQGYTAEALKRIIEYAFEDDNVYRISTGCIKENKGSEKVMIKRGYIWGIIAATW